MSSLASRLWRRSLQDDVIEGSLPDFILMFDALERNVKRFEAIQLDAMVVHHVHVYPHVFLPTFMSNVFANVGTAAFRQCNNHYVCMFGVLSHRVLFALVQDEQTRQEQEGMSCLSCFMDVVTG